MRDTNTNPPETLTITTLPEDAEKAGAYFDTGNCLLATALKRTFPGQRIDVTGFRFSIDKNRYDMPIMHKSEKDPIQECYKDVQTASATVTDPFTITAELIK